MSREGLRAFYRRHHR